MTSRTPGDGKNGAVEATLDDLPTVDTRPILKPVGATITLDEEPLPVSATQLLEPVAEHQAPAAPGQVIGVSEAMTTRRKGPLKADAFESAPSLPPARKEEGPVRRGAPAPWEKARVWTPGLIVLTVVGVGMLLLGLYVLLQG
ncbi:MAG: hypothetical protein Q8N23_18710 [Archangium sp.]|nr:hypothetical protein [Archangium sp.]MDP3154717.1 hypothetical protein [Archangium sp.]MDP3573607.1 hypothetical protein [Archangium sp.]